MKFSNHRPKIVVVGSASVDMILRTPHYPKVNETVLAEEVSQFLGGKGANQAIGTSRLGAEAYFVGCVGGDKHADAVLKNLTQEQVNIDYVQKQASEATGAAFMIESQGTVSVVVSPGANKLVSREHIDAAMAAIASADIVLTQLEIPDETILYLAEVCQKHNKKLGLYASPARNVASKVLDIAHFIIVKSADLSTVLGKESRDAALKNYPHKLFLRDDANSTIYFDGEEMRYYSNDSDTMPFRIGMGDAFTSGFAVALSHGNAIDECVCFGNQISRQVGLYKGSQKGLPGREE